MQILRYEGRVKLNPLLADFKHLQTSPVIGLMFKMFKVNVCTYLLTYFSNRIFNFYTAERGSIGGHGAFYFKESYIKTDQINIAVFFWYLVNSNLSSVHYRKREHYTRYQKRKAMYNWLPCT